jgi:hypothetical protein
MSVSYANALKDTRMSAVVTAIDAQSGVGYLEIGTAGMAALLVSINFQKPSFTEASQAITMAGAPKSGVATATGTAAAARIKDSAGTVQVSGLTVGTSGTDIVLNSTSITSGQTVTLTSAVITHSP